LESNLNTIHSVLWNTTNNIGVDREVIYNVLTQHYEPQHGF